MEERRSNEADVVIVKAKQEEEKEEERGGFKYIPEEIVFKVLPNLPAGSLLRFRCVSKQWSGPITSGITQVRKAIIPGNKPFLFRSLDENSQVEDIKIKLDQTLTWLHPNIFPWIYCSCNGFLLIGVGINLFLWNPTTRRSHGMLTYAPLMKYSREMVISGLCFDLANNDYRVVLGLKHRDERSVWMVSFKTKSWSRLNFSYDVGDFKSGPTLENCFYWWSEDDIIYFDPRIDNFRKISPQEFNHCGGEILGLGVLDGRLCMSRGKNWFSGENRLFLRKHYGVKKPWEEIFTIYSYEEERTFSVVDGCVNLTHLTPLFFTGESRVLIHVRRTECEQHYYNSDCEEYAASPVKLNDEYAVVEHDFKNDLRTDIVVSKVNRQPFEWPVVYEETLVRLFPPQNVCTTNNSRNKGILPCQGKQVWKVIENKKQSPKSENEEEKNAGLECEEK